MIPADETFSGTWPFAPHFCDAPGFRMHYVDEGQGDPIVCLHGEPTWGYLYRHMIPPLAESHRVVVPDHMGFGKSETPPDRIYTLKTHVENFTALVEALDLQNLTLVLQDWGGPIGCQFAIRHPDRVKRLFLANTVAGYGIDPVKLAGSDWFQWIGGGLENGRTEAVLRELGSTVLSVMKLIGFNANVSRTWVRAYSAPFPTRESCIGGYEFPIDAIQGRFAPFVEEAAPRLPDLAAIPAMYTHGLDDHAVPADLAMDAFRSVWPDAPVVPLAGVGHFCQEDAPDTLVALLRAFIQRAP